MKLYQKVKKEKSSLIPALQYDCLIFGQEERIFLFSLGEKYVFVFLSVLKKIVLLYVSVYI